jgi:hypothetical protein
MEVLQEHSQTQNEGGWLFVPPVDRRFSYGSPGEGAGGTVALGIILLRKFMLLYSYFIANF